MLQEVNVNRLALVILKNIVQFPAAYMKLCRHAKHPEKYTEQERYAHIQYMFSKVITSGNIDLQVFGKENIPTESGFFMTSNHQGLFDPIALVATCDMPLAAVMKKELYDLPILKQVVHSTNSFIMERDNIRQSLEVIKAVTEELKKGRNYFIYPEGTRSKNGNEILEFHSGSFKCATKAKCPIVPIAMIDSFKVLDQKGSKPVTVQMHFLKPIPYEEYQDMSTVEIAKMVHDRIEDTIKEYTGKKQ